MVGLALGLVGLGAWRLDTASGQGTVMKVVSPDSCPPGGGECEVQIQVENVANLGAYEWQIVYDPDVIELREPPASAIVDGGFLGDSGRMVSCQPPLLPPSQGLEPGNVRFGCNTFGSGPGVGDNGVLSTITFVPVADGSPNIQFVCAGLGTPLGDDIPISNVPACGSAVIPTFTPTPGPGYTPGPGNTPGPGDTPGPGYTPGPTDTPIPTGPTPTPTPLPPGLEAVLLVAGCNPVASTYPDDTSIQTIADAVGPAGNLVSLWKFDLGTWRAFSPQYPQVSDLTEADLLDVVFACVGGPGAFVRPVV